MREVPHLAVQRVIDFIEANYADGISLADVASALSYSPSHLTSLVRRVTGRPVTAWIIERRMLAARERLAASDESISAVAEAVGFRNVTYFTRRFARANGTTPSQWRSRYTAQRDVCYTCPACGALRQFETAG
jgi:AraC family transcriptional activator of pobA